jgi:hypothetical protein
MKLPVLDFIPYGTVGEVKEDGFHEQDVGKDDERRQYNTVSTRPPYTARPFIGGVCKVGRSESRFRRGCLAMLLLMPYQHHRNSSAETATAEIDRRI